MTFGTRRTRRPAKPSWRTRNLPLVGKILGRRWPRTTAGYAHLADAHLVEAAERVGSIIAAAMESAPPANQPRACSIEHEAPHLPLRQPAEDPMSGHLLNRTAPIRRRFWPPSLGANRQDFFAFSAWLSHGPAPFPCRDAMLTTGERHMTSSDRRLARAAPLAVAATFALLTLAACGGGGGGGPTSMMPPAQDLTNPAAATNTAAKIAGIIYLAESRDRR